MLVVVEEQDSTCSCLNPVLLFISLSLSHAPEAATEEKYRNNFCQSGQNSGRKKKTRKANGKPFLLDGNAIRE